MIYLAEAKFDKTSFVKVGHSKHPPAQIQELQTGCPVPIKLLVGQKKKLHCTSDSTNTVRTANGT